jgi:hypothetical protein
MIGRTQAVNVMLVVMETRVKLMINLLSLAACICCIRHSLPPENGGDKFHRNTSLSQVYFGQDEIISPRFPEKLLTRETPAFFWVCDAV